MFSNQRPVMAEILYSPAVRLICRSLTSCIHWLILATIRSNGESKSTSMVTKHAVSMLGKRRGVSDDKQSTDCISNNGSALKSWFDRDNPPDIEFTISGCGLLFPMQFMPIDTQSPGIKCTFAMYGERGMRYMELCCPYFPFEHYPLSLIWTISALALYLRDSRRLSLSV